VNEPEESTREDGTRIWQVTDESDVCHECHGYDEDCPRCAGGGAEHGIQLLHREDGPAVIEPDGSVEYWVNGERHREDGPAVIPHRGKHEWWVRGNRHRTDGPAVCVPGRPGNAEWWVRGKKHRADGPAIESTFGATEYWVNGKLHREDGPAVETFNNGNLWQAEYWVNGKLHREGDYARFHAFEGVHEWHLNGKLHRTDGPAIVRRDGSTEYWVDGKAHREGGPAVIRADGSRSWHQDGRLHRTDGPAVEEEDGYTEWWVYGKRLPRIDTPLIEGLDPHVRATVLEQYRPGTYLPELIANTPPF
jgi:hypothetical protein